MRYQHLLANMALAPATLVASLADDDIESSGVFMKHYMNAVLALQAAELDFTGTIAVTLEQGDGTTWKALTFDGYLAYDSSTKQLAEVEASTLAVVTEEDLFVLFEVNAEQLDRGNKFDRVRMVLTGSTLSTTTGVIAITALGKPSRYIQEVMPDLVV
jgi:hypothetical protein